MIENLRGPAPFSTRFSVTKFSALCSIAPFCVSGFSTRGHPSSSQNQFRWILRGRVDASVWAGWILLSLGSKTFPSSFPHPFFFLSGSCALATTSPLRGGGFSFFPRLQVSGTGPSRAALLVGTSRMFCQRDAGRRFFQTPPANLFCPIPPPDVSSSWGSYPSAPLPVSNSPPEFFSRFSTPSEVSSECLCLSYPDLFGRDPTSAFLPPPPGALRTLLAIPLVGRIDLIPFFVNSG